MYISERLKEQIRTLVEQGYFRDSENEEYIAEKVTFRDGKFFLTFIDYTGTTHECWEDEEEYTREDYEADEAERAYKERKIDELFKMPELNIDYKEKDHD